ncbi:prolipoprotein diacylglyceryl transferase [Candidatus Peregrinibacteria bacterium]|nr:prolipoprotein diacylglyceryl transferase [Candidatus Peregrinibacteria bacterium]
MHPIIFKTDFFILHTYWIFFALAAISGTYSLIHFSIKNGMKLQFLSSNSAQLLLFALIGARLGALLVNYHIYFTEISFGALARLFYIWDGGLDFWGAITAFLIILYHLCKKHDQDFWKWLDSIIPSMILGLGFAHIGAFFEGINYGRETSLPWGVNFESPIIKYAVPIHPTQIYATLFSFGLAYFLIFMADTKIVQKLKTGGFIGILGITIYNFLRFLEEFVRGDDTITVFDIRTPQIIAFIITTAGIALLQRRFQLLWIKK